METKVSRMQLHSSDGAVAFCWQTRRVYAKDWMDSQAIEDVYVETVALNNKHWKESGLQSLLERYKHMRYIS